MLFRQLFDSQSSTYTYLMGDERSGEAVLIDPVFEQATRDIALVRELGVSLTTTLETHVHADHVTGGWLLREKLGSRFAISAASGAEGADLYLKDRDRVPFGRRWLQVRGTPGHTNGCVSYVLDDESMAFTGDCLLVRGCGRTDFQQGDARAMYRSVRAQLFSLPETCHLYPAHDYRGNSVTTVREEQRYNPRLGGQLSEDDFVGYMENLGLAHPKQIDVAVPANLRCGRGANTDALAEQPTWGPLSLTYAGIWEIEPNWVEEHLHDVLVLDVREPHEFDGPLGHIPGARLLPLGQLAERVAELPREKPIVAVCRAGGRSAQATVILRKHGLEKLANLTGGMLNWRALHLTVEGAQD